MIEMTTLIALAALAARAAAAGDPGGLVPVDASAVLDLSLELDPEVASQLAAHKAGALEGITQHVAQFIASGDLPRWSVLELDVAILGPAHEACRRFLGGAPLDPKWMRNTLPRLAWKSVAPA